jgi:hypothetical protein
MGGTICRTLNHLPPQTICNLLFGIWSAPLRQLLRWSLASAASAKTNEAARKGGRNEMNSVWPTAQFAFSPPSFLACATASRAAFAINPESFWMVNNWNPIFTIRAA